MAIDKANHVRERELSDSGGSGTPSDLVVEVGDLLHRLGASRRVLRSVAVPGLHTPNAGVPEGETVDLDLKLEAISDGIVVRGDIGGTWRAECSRCLETVEEPFSVEVHDLYEPDPVESETYLLDGDHLDLEPLVRDAVIVEIPAVPLCDDACLGLCPQCGADRNRESCDCSTHEADPRWAALDALTFEDSEP